MWSTWRRLARRRHVLLRLCAADTVRFIVNCDDGSERRVALLTREAGGVVELRGVLHHVALERHRARRTQGRLECPPLGPVGRWRRTGPRCRCRRGLPAESVVAAEGARLKDVVHAHEVRHDREGLRRRQPQRTSGLVRRWKAAHMSSASRRAGTPSELAVSKARRWFLSGSLPSRRSKASLVG